VHGKLFSSLSAIQSNPKLPFGMGFTNIENCFNIVNGLNTFQRAKVTENRDFS